MTTIASFAKLSDKDLLTRARSLAAAERSVTAQLIAALAELDMRRLYLQGCRSMFTYCTEVLHLSESASYARIEAARAVRRFPCILKLLEDGAITLTTVGLLASHLTDENHERLLVSATYKSKRQVEAFVAALAPQPAVPAVVRKLPSRAGAGMLVERGAGEPQHAAQATTSPAAAHVQPAILEKPAIVVPLSPERYKLQLTMSKETHDKLRRVQDLMRHTNPKGDAAVIFDRAITMLLNSLEKAKVGATDRPRIGARASSAKSGKSRYIPAAIKRAVWRRDGGRFRRRWRGNRLEYPAAMSASQRSRGGAVVRAAHRA